MATFQVGPPQGMAKDINPTALPNEVFSKTFKPPITNGSGNPRKNLRFAKKILEQPT